MVHFKDYDNYKPDFTPKQMFEMGIFGGSYFRPIHSNVTNQDYVNQHKEFKFLDSISPNLLTNTKQEVNLNKYKTKASLSLKYWEDHGWIKPQDPYGHIQWYCRFYNGRRTEDDERQINRSNNFLIRFGNRKVKSETVKQSLLHWGWDHSVDHSEYIKMLRAKAIKK